MSSTNDVQNSIAPATQGGVVASGETWRRVRTTAEALAWTKTTTNSTEIQRSRNLQDVVDIGAQGGGTIAAELHTPTSDTDAFVFLTSLMCNSFDVSRTRAPSGLTISVDGSGTLNLNVGVYPVGSVVYFDGIAAGLNGPWLILTSNASTLTAKRPAGYAVKPFSYPVAATGVPVGTSVERIGSTIGNAVTISPVSGGATVDFGGNVGLSTGDWFSLQNTANPGNAGFYRIASMVGNVATCSPAPVSVASESGTSNVYLFIGAGIKNGIAPSYFNVTSVNYGDNGSVLAKMRTGMRTGSSQFSFDASNIATVTHTLMGMNETVQQSDPYISDVQIKTPAMSSRANVAMISVNGQQLSGLAAVRTLTLTVNNTLRAQTGMGSYGLVGIGDGTFAVSGSFSAYFQSNGVYQSYMNGDYVPLHWGIGKNGGYLFFSLPKCKFTSAQNSAKGLNQDLTDDINFTAQEADEGPFTMQMSYFAWVGAV